MKKLTTESKVVETDKNCHNVLN